MTDPIQWVDEMLLHAIEIICLKADVLNKFEQVTENIFLIIFLLELR